MANKQSAVTIELGGQRYRMVTDTDETHLRRLAGVVNQHIDALGERATRSLSPAQQLAIVALTLAEELEAQQSAQKQLEDSASATTQKAIECIDRALAAGRGFGR